MPMIKNEDDANTAYSDVESPLSNAQLEVSPEDAAASTYGATQAQAAQQGSNAFQGVSTDPSVRAAQMQALQQLQSTAQGGLNASDKAALYQVGQQQNAQNTGQQQAILQAAQSRGALNSGEALAAQLAAQQNTAQNANAQGVNVAGEAQQRALNAMLQSGQFGGQLENQQFGEQAQKAAAANAIAQFNAANTQQTGLANMGAQNAAAAQNAQQQQQANQFNAQQGMNAQQFNAQALLNNYQAQQNAAAQQANTALGQQAQNLAPEQMALSGVGSVLGAAGTIAAAAHGGRINGHAHVPGDSPKNDTVPAMLSPGEIVLPRSVVNSPSKIIEFLEKETGMSFGGSAKAKSEKPAAKADKLPKQEKM